MYRLDAVRGWTGDDGRPAEFPQGTRLERARPGRTVAELAEATGRTVADMELAVAAASEPVGRERW